MSFDSPFPLERLMDVIGVFDPKTMVLVFLGSNAQFFKSDTHFLVTEWIRYLTHHFPHKDKWALKEKPQKPH